MLLASFDHRFELVQRNRQPVKRSVNGRLLDR